MLKKGVLGVAQRKRLGDILQERGLLSKEQLREALEFQRTTGDKLGEALIKLDFISPEDIADALSEHLRIPRVDFKRRYISSDVVKLVPENVIREQQVLPIELEGNFLSVAMVDPLNIMVIDDLQRITGYLIKPMIATADEIESAYQRSLDIAGAAQQMLAQYGEDEGESEAETEKEKAEAQFIGNAPGVKLANMILEQAIKQKASDVHLEPREEDLRVRFRIDGIMRDIMVVPRHLRADVNSRIKIMANMDITERRRPQDGRMQIRLDQITVDMRVSSLPTVHGEKIVVRLLQQTQDLMNIEEFGFGPENLDKVQRMLRQSQGLILVTGPTGSGKTTTLYGFLNQLNSPDKNIITVEDPVEYRLAGINQVQINPKVDLTFANGLRSVLRQDPDIIMVGEIRDGDTADIAVRAALTGHLVLSTLHTNSAVASITRLVNMGLEPYLISSTVIGVIAQRLVRTICPDCREAVPLTDPVVIRFIKSLGITPPEVVYRGKGCPLCGDTGYRGRTMVEEVLLFSKELRLAVDRGAHDEELKEIALRGGMQTLQIAAVDKLARGITTSDEVLRTVYSVEDEEEV
ncbi:MAG TPA: Flp pilus assembly complex ATPase component TadA [Firmicutes bacterium]|nr:Flp pilus assembly complex ATPase component TadA [Bacillota bacterium]